MNDYERTMREEGWMLTDELFLAERPEPPEVIAFRLVQEEDWTHFIMDVTENPAMRFFNPEIREFSHAATWEELSEQYGIAPFKDELAIPAGLPENVQNFCRELRNSMRERGEEGCGGCKAFHSPSDWALPRGSLAVLVVLHEGGNMAPRFNTDYEVADLYAEVDNMLFLRKLWREHESSEITYIYNV
jgi:hypothetical protein